MTVLLVYCQYKAVRARVSKKIPKFQVTNCFGQIVADIVKGNRTGLLTSLSDADAPSGCKARVPNGKLHKELHEFGNKVLLFNVAK